MTVRKRQTLYRGGETAARVGQALRVAIARPPCAETSKLLHPGAKFDLPGPRAARLPQHLQIGLRNRVGVEHRVRLVRGLGSTRISNAAVDHEMADVNPQRGEFASHALRESAKGELAHRERG